MDSGFSPADFAAVSRNDGNGWGGGSSSTLTLRPTGVAALVNNVGVVAGKI